LALELTPNGQTEHLDIPDGWVVYLYRSIRLIGADIVKCLLGAVAVAVYLTWATYPAGLAQRIGETTFFPTMTH